MPSLPTEGSRRRTPIDIAYAALRFRFRVDADDELANEFARLYEPLAIAAHRDGDDCVLTVRSDDGGLAIQLDGRPDVPADCGAGALASLMGVIDAESVLASGDLLVFHASAVLRSEQTVFLIGPSGAGKSTLAAACTTNGFTYVGDEALGVEQSGGQLLSNPKPFKLDDASLDALSELTRIALPRPESPGSEALVCASDLGAVVRPSWVDAPRTIVRVEFVAAGETCVVPLTPADMAETLADQCFNFASWGARGLDLVASLARRARGFHLTFGRLDEAVAALDALVP
jgi:hypothetical protein